MTKTGSHWIAATKPSTALRIRAHNLLSSRHACVAAALAALVALHACVIEIEAPPEVGYLAVILSADAPPEVSPGDHYIVRIRELSGTYPIDDTIIAQPNDTIIRSAPVASYDIFVDSVPEACTSRSGYAHRAHISSNGNTSITRFNFVCNSLLALTVVEDGRGQLDDAFVWILNGPGGERFGTIAPNDTVRFDHITAGGYTVELGHIAENCVILTDGWRKQTVVIQPPLPAAVRFRVRCSDPAASPRIVHFGSSIRDGTSGFYAEIVDPQKDVATYAWNVSDCAGGSVYRHAIVTRGQLHRDPRTAGVDTVRIAATVPLPENVGGLEPTCTAFIALDVLGNTTAWVEERTGNEAGVPPHIDVFNVVHGADSLKTTLSVSDPDGDVGGAFLSITLRDGVLFGQLDGKPDVGIYNVAGYVPPFVIPSLQLRDGFRLIDVLSVRVDVLDRAGNMVSAIDTDFAR